MNHQQRNGNIGKNYNLDTYAIIIPQATHTTDAAGMYM